MLAISSHCFFVFHEMQATFYHFDFVQGVADGL